MDVIHTAYDGVYLAALIIIGIGLMLSLVRAIRGPRTADRILGVNMAGTMTILMLILLAYLLKIEGLVDVALIYCLASFLSVVVLSKIYVTVYREKLQKQDLVDEKGERTDA